MIAEQMLVGPVTGSLTTQKSLKSTNMNDNDFIIFLDTAGARFVMAS